MKTLRGLVAALTTFAQDPRTLVLVAILLPMLKIQGRAFLVALGGLFVLRVEISGWQSAGLVSGFLLLVLLQALVRLSAVSPAHRVAGGTPC